MNTIRRFVGLKTLAGIGLAAIMVMATQANQVLALEKAPPAEISVQAAIVSQLDTAPPAAEFAIQTQPANTVASLTGAVNTSIFAKITTAKTVDPAHHRIVARIESDHLATAIEYIPDRLSHAIGVGIPTNQAAFIGMNSSESATPGGGDKGNGANIDQQESLVDGHPETATAIHQVALTHAPPALTRVL